jgi:hypothetical protein
MKMQLNLKIATYLHFQAAFRYSHLSIISCPSKYMHLRDLDSHLGMIGYNIVLFGRIVFGLLRYRLEVSISLIAYRTASVLLCSAANSQLQLCFPLIYSPRASQSVIGSIIGCVAFFIGGIFFFILIVKMRRVSVRQ